MYCTREGTTKAVSNLRRSLTNDGWLIVSPTETSQELFSEFATVAQGDVTIYRKSAHRKSATNSKTTPVLPAFDDDKFCVSLPKMTLPIPARVPPVEAHPKASID